jgi:hypothetical protein
MDIKRLYVEGYGRSDGLIRDRYGKMGDLNGGSTRILMEA